MRVIPVLDLRKGVVVHAVRGERARYRPLRSQLVAGADPAVVAGALIERFRLRELYVADLGAIAGDPLDRSLAAVCDLAPTLVDAGAATPETVDALLAAGATTVALGSESLPAGALPRLLAARPRVPFALSVDLRGGRLLSPDAVLAGRSAAEAVPRLLGDASVRELIVIDLAQVGSDAGPPLEAVEQVIAAAPGVPVLAGGGVRNVADLRRLADAGAAGALVATALHSGAITPEKLARLD